MRSFDAAQAVSVREFPGGRTYVFSTLPETAEEIEALKGVLPLDDQRNTAALFIASLVRYVSSADDGIKMIDALRGPRPQSTMEKQFLRDRFMDKKYLADSYFAGAVPANSYRPDEPRTLTIYDDPVAPPQGYAYCMAESGGADSRRRIMTRMLKDGTHCLWEYPGILVGIRLPASDPGSDEQWA